MTAERKRRVPPLARVRDVGREMIDGPRSLFPPIDIDDFGWLEPQLRISLGPAHYQLDRSMVVFADDTVNRDSEFLPPLVRLAHWDRRADLESRATWPTISVEFFTLRHWQTVDAAARVLQEAAKDVPFEPFGVSATREVPELVSPQEYAGFEVLLLNGIQRLQLHSPALANDPFYALVMDTWSVIEAECVPFDATGWRERYNYDLASLAPLSSWDREVRGSAV